MTRTALAALALTAAVLSTPAAQPRVANVSLTAVTGIKVGHHTLS